MDVAMSLETETALAPYVVADCVLSELARHLGAELATDERALADKLGDFAYACYAANRHRRFGRQLRGKHGREYLYMWMRHWLSGELRWTRHWPNIPDSFKNGVPIKEDDNGKT